MGDYQSGSVIVRNIEHYRNGSGGNGFYLVLFETQQSPRKVMAAVAFCVDDPHKEHQILIDGGYMAILDVDSVAKENIKFPNNSWRFEYFYKGIEEAINKHLKEWYKKQGIPTEEDTFCSICGKPFSLDEWDARHSDEDGQDCHENCCPICNK